MKKGCCIALLICLAIPILLIVYIRINPELFLRPREYKITDFSDSLRHSEISITKELYNTCHIRIPDNAHFIDGCQNINYMGDSSYIIVFELDAQDDDLRSDRSISSFICDELFYDDVWYPDLHDVRTSTCIPQEYMTGEVRGEMRTNTDLGPNIEFLVGISDNNRVQCVVHVWDL